MTGSLADEHLIPGCNKMEFRETFAPGPPKAREQRETGLEQGGVQGNAADSVQSLLEGTRLSVGMQSAGEDNFANFFQ